MTIKSCPCCGSNNIGAVSSRDPEEYARVCLDCGLRSGMKPTKEEAKEAWNIRSGEKHFGACHFCGCSVGYVEYPPDMYAVASNTHKGLRVACRGCNAEMISLLRYSHDEVMELWNRRADNPLP